MNISHPVVKASRFDDIQTPAYGINPLLPFIPKDWFVWECACGKGQMLDAFLRAGYDGRGSDIADGWDFFDDQTTMYFDECDIIVTNPPYSLKDAFLKRCYELGKPFALLMPLTALEGKKRGELYARHGLQLIVPNSRINFDTGTGKQACWFASAWYCWGLPGIPENSMRFVPLVGK